MGRRALGLALLGCGACAVGPGASSPTDQARRQFSREAYCPVDRVVATRIIPMPVAPPAIARDPERLAMWRAHWLSQAEADPRRTIAVSGCGERATYACWELGGTKGTGRGKQRIVVGASCNEVARPGQPVSTRSTIPGPDPKTMASSR